MHAKGINKMVLFLLPLVLIVFACSQETSSEPPTSNNGLSQQHVQEHTPAIEPNKVEVVQPESEPPPDPLTLEIYDNLFTDSEFSSFIASPVAKAYPHISFKRTTTQSGIITDIEKFVAANALPDIIMIPDFQLQMLNQMKVTMNHEALIKKHNTDMSVLDPVVVDTLKNVSGIGQIVAMPLYKNVVATFYNKDIFDRFGVNYPTDGMTYDEVIAVARDVTRQDEGVKYLGMFPGGWNLQRGQLSLTVLDQETGKPLITQEEGFKQIFRLNQDINNIPGMERINNGGQARDRFFQDQRLAILVDWIAEYLTKVKQAEQEINWDMVTMPEFPQKPGKHSMSTTHNALVTSTSDNKDDAFLVTSLLSTSKEVQTIMSRAGRVSVLKDTSVYDVFGADFLIGKNINVLKQTNLVPSKSNHALEKENQLVYAPVNQALNKVLNGNADINTALTEAAEIIEQNIAHLR